MNTISAIQKVLYVTEFIAFVTSVVLLKKYRGTVWKYFPVYLAFIVLGEQLGNYLNNIENYRLKGYLINYALIPAEFLFFYFIYYSTAASRNAKRLVLVCLLVYILAFFTDYLYFSNKEYYFMSFSYSVGNLVLLVLIISYFVQLSGSNKVIKFSQSLQFWVSLGLLIFYLGTFPYFGLLFLLYDKFRDVYYVYSVIMLICNCLMYLLFITGLICSKTN
jgi:hypothetical protein